MDRTQDLILQIGTKLFSKLCKHYFLESRTSQIVKMRQLTIQTLIYHWIYLGARKVFSKRQVDFSCNTKMYPFEGLLNVRIKIFK